MHLAFFNIQLVPHQTHLVTISIHLTFFNIQLVPLHAHFVTISIQLASFNIQLGPHQARLVPISTRFVPLGLVQVHSYRSGVTQYIDDFPSWLTQRRTKTQLVQTAPIDIECISELNVLIQAPIDIESISELNALIQAPINNECISELNVFIQAPIQIECISDLNVLIQALIQIECISDLSVLIQAPIQIECISDLNVLIQAPIQIECISDINVLIQAPIQIECISDLNIECISDLNVLIQAPIQIECISDLNVLIQAPIQIECISELNVLIQAPIQIQCISKLNVLIQAPIQIECISELNVLVQAPIQKRRRPSFPQGGLDWHIRRKTSIPRSVRHAPATMSDLANEDDDCNECENKGCCCGEQNNISGVTVTLTDDNQNAPNNTPASTTAASTKNLCTCKRTLKKARKPPKTTIFINVGGQVFETYKTTLKKMRNSVLADEMKLKHFWRPEVGDYFFDRDPQGFACILNYYRTGELHIPTNMCGPSLQNELTFWGIDELDIERCCWTQYNTWKTQSRSLQKLEYDRKSSTIQDTMYNKASASCWTRYRWNIWRFLQDPTSSLGAKVYAWISIIFVLVSIFSFCAETHPHFQVQPSEIKEEWHGLYQFLNMKVIEWNPGGIHNTTGTANGSFSDNDQQFTDVEEKNRTKDDMYLAHPSLVLMDLTCLAYFTLEYFTRFFCSPSKIKFLRALQNIIDFIAIAPDYINIALLFIQPSNGKGMVIMEFMFILRMLRLCRIFRLIRHVPGLWILLYTLKASFNELMLMFVFLLIGMVVFASLMHFAEGENGFDNIPIGFWWSVVTMTTVGYGDMYPQTAFGYIIGSLCAIAGLLMIAFTVPIIVSNFVLYYTHVQYGLARRDRDPDTGKEDEEEQRKMENSDGNISPVGLSSKIHPDCTAIELGENISLTASAGSANVSECNFRTLSVK
ncbi:uncharacterized protein LOC121368819 [Gigantopelta aegis]|uniref:uncharacterized protein LOC121368819 n=1 Tax=Gigantopelta aegis TaxID=1735272 RepID=UPI001B88BA7D|nr:uncharacterized protein LOC121368819 [Gigantopelta aegis]